MEAMAKQCVVSNRKQGRKPHSRSHKDPASTPPNKTATTRRAGAQRRRRLKFRARIAVKFFLTALVDKRIFNLRSMTDLPEVQRLRALIHAAKVAGTPRATIVALCIIDAAVRNPKFTCLLIKRVAQGQPRATAPSILRVALRLSKTCSVLFWQGLGRSNLMRGIRAWSESDLEKIGHIWVRAGATAKCQRLLAPIASLPRVGPYLGHALLRYVAAALDVSVWGGETIASDMSPHVGLLYSVTSFRDLRGHMVASGIPTARTWSWNLFAALYCEGTKILCDQGVLQNPAEYTGDPETLHVAFCARRCRAFLHRLEAAPVLEDWFSEEVDRVRRTLDVQDTMRSLAVIKRCRFALADA